MPAERLTVTRRSRSAMLAAFLILAALMIQPPFRAAWASDEPSTVAVAWKTARQEVATLVVDCQFEKAIAQVSDFIKANPGFGPAYEHRAWVTLDWLDLRDEVSLIDVPLRHRAMADPCSGLGNIEPAVEVRRVFVEDWFHLKYVPPAEMKTVQHDLEACRRLMGKEFASEPLEAYMAEFVGNYGRANELINERCQDGTATPREYLIQSRLLRIQGDMNGALTAAGAAWKSPETRSQAGSRAINILRVTQRVKDAQSFLNRWPQAGAGDPRLIYNRMGFTSDPDAIFKDFDVLMAMLPREPGLYYGRATREMQYRKDAEASMAALNHAVALKTKSLLPYYARSCLWAKQDDAKSSLADATTAIECCPYFDMSYQLRAKAYRRIGDVESARRDERYQSWLKQLYELHSKYKRSPENEDVAVELAHHYSRGEEWKPALRTLTQCLKRAPKHIEALRERCQIYLAMGNLDPALADANAIVAITPEPGSFSLRGDVFAQRRDWDKAVRDFERAKCLDDRLEHALRQRAAWHSASGRVEPAKADLEHADRVSQAGFDAPEK